MSSTPPTVGPLRDQPLRPDVRYASGILTNSEVGLRLGFNHVFSNLVSILAMPGPSAEWPEQPSADQTREEIFRSTLEAMNKALQVDKLAPPEDFGDALARGLGESGAPLIETMALSYLTAGIVSPLAEGIATKVPYLYSWLFPVARDAITFGTQSALEPGATIKSTEISAGTGALLRFLGPYGRLTRAIGGAALGTGQEYTANPRAQLTDYARNAALMGTFAAIGGAHGITPDEAAMFTIIDWAKTKGYSPEVLEQTIKAHGLEPIANEFGEDVTAPQMENRSGAIVGTRPEESGAASDPAQPSVRMDTVTPPAMEQGALKGELDIPEDSVDASKSEAAFGQATTNDYRSTFFAAHPELEEFKSEIIVHHAVEQVVLTKFPGVVTEQEIHSLENLRGIPKGVNSRVHLREIRREWDQFYDVFTRTGTAPTKAQLLQKATGIDSKFGSKFMPPVGGE